MLTISNLLNKCSIFCLAVILAVPVNCVDKRRHSPEVEKEHKTIANRCLEMIGHSMPLSENQFPLPLTTASRMKRRWVSYDFVSANCLVEIFLSDASCQHRNQQIDFLSLSAKLEVLTSKTLSVIERNIDSLLEQSRDTNVKRQFRHQLEIKKSIREFKREKMNLIKLLDTIKSSIYSIEIEIDKEMESCLLSERSLKAVARVTRSQRINQIANEQFGGIGIVLGDLADTSTTLYDAVLAANTDCRRQIENGPLLTRIEELCKLLRAQISLQQLTETS